MNLTDLCATGEYLANNVYFRAILITRIIIAQAGIVFFMVLFRFQGRHLALHKNAHVLLISHHIWVILQCVTCIGINSFDLHRYSQYHNDSCDYLIPMSVSAPLRGSTAVPYYGNVLALLAITLERLVATYNYQTYERTGQYYWSVIFIAAQWFLAVSSTCLIVLNANWSEMKLPITMTSAKTTTLVSNMSTSMAVVELVSLGVLYGLLRYNERKKTQLSEASLTEKYQVDENLRSIRLMIPMVITHFCCFMPSLVAFPIYYAVYPDADPRQYAIFLEAFGTIILYSVLLPVVLFWRHKILRESLRKSIGAFDRVEPEELRADGRTREQMRHFARLGSEWERQIALRQCK